MLCLLLASCPLLSVPGVGGLNHHEPPTEYAFGDPRPRTFDGLISSHNDVDNILQLILNEQSKPSSFVKIDKRLRTFASDAYVRARYFLARHGKAQAMFFALGRGDIVTERVIEVALSFEHIRSTDRQNWAGFTLMRRPRFPSSHPARYTTLPSRLRLLHQ